MESNASESVAPSGKYRHIGFCLLPQLLIVLLVLGIWGGGYWLLLPSVFLMVIVPLLDLITGWQDTAHFDKNDFSPAELSLLHWNTRLYAVFYMAAVVYVAMSLPRFTGAEIGMLIGACGLLGGIGFGAAHELLHAKEKIDQVLQKITTAFLFYPHYKLIHIRSHHLHAGTDHDENTAWMNESIYSYIFRTIPGSMIRCWQLEARVLGASGERSFGVTFFKNKMVPYALGQVALLLALFLLAGPGGLLFYLAQVIGAHIVLESVNYIQHYGLMREKREGEYEKTGAEHSWDTYHYFSSYVTFRVGHHSFHHIAVKPYYLLDSEPEAPKLPVGYFWAIPIVFLPPWWRRLINPRLSAVS
ncbi:MAG: fatty acid desaturase [Prosthecobacter sp.]|nr:fatty acid desaturase [Prosthecobacter sp.]